MTIKATANQTKLTRTLSRESVLSEIAPGDNEGGAVATWTPDNVRTLRKVDNDATRIFTKGNEHLDFDKPQVQFSPVQGGLDIDFDQHPDTSLGRDPVTGAHLTEDTDSYNIDTNGNGIANHVIPKP